MLERKQEKLFSWNSTATDEVAGEIKTVVVWLMTPKAVVREVKNSKAPLERLIAAL